MRSLVNKKWLTLILKADESVLEIIDAHLQSYYLGMSKNENHWLFYFEIVSKSKVETILKSLIQQYKISVKWETIKSEPWHLSWQEDFKTIKISDEMVVIPDWDKKNYSEKYIIKIRPGMAFGTGHHFTTKLMLRALLKWLKPEQYVLDIGTGSGILAIASSKLGASKVDAVENDTECIENFEENLQLNKIGDSVKMHISDALEWKDYSYDLILANVNRNVIMKLIPKIINTRSIILLSGLLETDENLVTDQCKSNNFVILEILREDEWICLAIKQKESI